MKNFAKQRGAISTGLVVALGFVALMVGLIIICAVSYIGAHNTGVSQEAGLKAAYSNNENILSNYSQKIREAAGVTDMARDDIAKVAQAAIQGRYGADGSKAVFQAIHEQNPNIDPALYRKLQQLIEAGRDEFKVSQTTLLDKKAVYEKKLGYFWSGMWLGIAGFPKMDLDKLKMISNDYASDAFAKGKETGPILLRQPAK